MNEVNKNRMKKELEMLSSAPPTGISCVPAKDRLDELIAQIIGPLETPFEGGIFQLKIQIPERYPFEPPCIRFITPIYHPNIDTSGRICLDTLKMPPKGTWRPCLNLSTVLMMIRVLMTEPGSEDPLMADIWQEFKYDFTTYTEKAKQWTRQHAMHNQGSKESATSKPDNRKSRCLTNVTTNEVQLGSCHKSLDHSSKTGIYGTDNVAASSLLKKDHRKTLGTSEMNINDAKKVKYSSLLPSPFQLP